MGCYHCRQFLDISINLDSVGHGTNVPTLSNPTSRSNVIINRSPLFYNVIPDWPSASKSSADKPPDPLTETFPEKTGCGSATDAPAQKLPAQISASVRRLYISEANLRLCIRDEVSVWVHSGRAVLALVGSVYHPPTFVHPHNHFLPVASSDFCIRVRPSGRQGGCGNDNDGHTTGALCAATLCCLFHLRTF